MEYPPPWALKSNPLPLYIPFFQERYPFSVCYIGKWYLFQIPCLNALYFKQESTDFIKPENSSVSSFTDPNDRFPYPFIILQLVKSLPFHIPEGRLQKDTYPFRVEPSRLGHHREFPTPPPRKSNLGVWIALKQLFFFLIHFFCFGFFPFVQVTLDLGTRLHT